MRGSVRSGLVDARGLAKVVAESLAAAGSRVVFGIPGGGNNLELIGAAEDAGMRFVLGHTEAAAAYMASVHGELTGTSTACLATRGPGAANAVNGVAQAWLDRQPLVMLTDAVSAADTPRIGHQRIDQPATFAPITKWSGAVGAAGAGDVMKRLVALTLAGRPGPVHVDLDPGAGTASAVPEGASVRSGDLGAVAEAVRRARRPVVLVGLGARDAAGAVRELVRGTNVPVLPTYKAAGVVPSSGPNAAGLLTGATVEAPVLEAADLILAVGLDTVELIPAPWRYEAPVVTLAPWPEESPYFTPAHEVVGPLAELLQDLPRLNDDWEPGYAAAQRAACVERLVAGPPAREGLAPWEVVAAVRDVAPAGSVATVDSGAHMLAAMPQWAAEEPGELLISSGLATMGFALPAAIAAGLARPDRRTFCFTGDGGLGMVLAELETLARLNLPVTVVVFNDSALSLIKVKQRPTGHGGAPAIAYRPVDYAALAAAHGLTSSVVGTVPALTEAATAALKTSGPTLIDARVDPAGYPHILDVIRGVR
ncbi:MAG: hypothetical protein GEV11_21215 [Streptosporangiales bacterium]|nr:hypothetical protein [Streptosporangiales bacterium]